ANEIGATGEVAPLVTTTALEHAPVLSVEFQKVKPLQDLVAKFCVADALFGVQPFCHDIFFDHGAQAKVILNVTWRVYRRHGCCPVEVVDEARSVLALEAQVS